MKRNAMEVEGLSMSGFKEPSSLFLDTNVVLSSFISQRKGSADAQKIIDFAITHNIKVYIAATTLKDFYYLFSLETKRQMRADPSMQGRPPEDIAAIASELAWGCLENICELMTVASMGQGDVWLARKLRAVHEDFEDDFILACAMRCDAGAIVTNDSSLRLHSPLPAYTCAELVSLLGLTGQS